MPPKRKISSKKNEEAEVIEKSNVEPDGEVESKTVEPASEDESKKKSSKFSIHIDHSKECQCFKVRAAKMEKAFKDMGHSVTINKEKPRKGAFVITIEGREKPFFELLNMPRPFTKLKNTDLDAVIESLK